MKKAIFLWLMGMPVLVANAQDIHFSQFFHVPFNINPAEAGMFDGDYRLGAVQRTQWRSVTKPYSTFGLSGDLAFQEANAGASLSLYQDRAGDSRFNTFRVEPGVSLHLAASADSAKVLSLGMQFSLTNRSIDYSDLYFDNQYNGFGYDPSLNPGESFVRDSRWYFDAHIGALFSAKVDARKRYKAGFALFNLVSPEQSFFEASIPLDKRINIHGSAEWDIHDEWDIIPGLLISLQGTYREVIIGGTARRILNNRGGLYRTAFGGMYFRARDAGFLMMGMDYDDWRVALSYDVNLSDLRVASDGRGGLEITVQYILRTFKPGALNKKICLEYL
jgi:type IX secretion system PorP/SprF family membrane protein